MGIEFTSNFDRVAKQIMNEASDAMHEALAERGCCNGSRAWHEQC